MKRLVAIMTLALAPTTASASSSSSSSASAVATIVTAAKFHGDVMVQTGDATPLSVRTLDRRAPLVWRWASVTKQIIATLILQEVARKTIDLDRPVSAYLPGFRSPNASLVSVRHLIRHQSGLPNPNDTAAGADGIELFYGEADKRMRDPLTGYCAGLVKGAPGGDWSYNNCDYMVAGALLEAVTGQSWQQLVRERIAMPAGMRATGAFPTARATVSGTVNGKPEPRYRIDRFGAAAGLYGTASDLLRFDRALMTGKLLPEAERSAMWDGRPELGFMAIGQWAFGAKLKGCPMPVRIIERRGAIGGVQVRNFILPDADIAVVAFTDRDDFDFGEIWQGKGFSYDLLSTAACAS